MELNKQEIDEIKEILDEMHQGLSHGIDSLDDDYQINAVLIMKLGLKQIEELQRIIR